MLPPELLKLVASHLVDYDLEEFVELTGINFRLEILTKKFREHFDDEEDNALFLIVNDTICSQIFSIDYFVKFIGKHPGFEQLSEKIITLNGVNLNGWNILFSYLSLPVNKFSLQREIDSLRFQYFLFETEIIQYFIKYVVRPAPPHPLSLGFDTQPKHLHMMLSPQDLADLLDILIDVDAFNWNEAVPYNMESDDTTLKQITQLCSPCVLFKILNESCKKYFSGGSKDVHHNLKQCSLIDIEKLKTYVNKYCQINYLGQINYLRRINYLEGIRASELHIICSQLEKKLYQHGIRTLSGYKQFYDVFGSMGSYRASISMESIEWLPMKRIKTILNKAWKLSFSRRKPENCVVAGGSVLWAVMAALGRIPDVSCWANADWDVFSGVKMNDVIKLCNQHDFCIKCSDMVTECFQEDCYDVRDAPIPETDTRVGLITQLKCFDKNPVIHSEDGVDYLHRHLQLINDKSFSDPVVIICNFDISCCQLYWDGENVFMSPACVHSLKTGIAWVYNNTKPERIIKYAARGFQIEMIDEEKPNGTYVSYYDVHIPDLENESKIKWKII